MIQAQYDLLSRRRKSPPAAHALVADGRGHPGGKRGGRGGGPGGSNNNRKVKKSSDGDDDAEGDKPSGKGPMCYNCHDRGRFARDCTVKVCKRCRGRGHEEDKRPSPADMKSNLAVELPDSESDSTTSSVAASGFVAIDTAGCGSLPGKCNGGNCDGTALEGR